MFDNLVQVVKQILKSVYVVGLTLIKSKIFSRNGVYYFKGRYEKMSPTPTSHKYYAARGIESFNIRSLLVRADLIIFTCFRVVSIETIRPDG